MARAGLSADSVVAAAAAVADERGLQGVTLALLAERLGVRPPSLYAHVGGLEDLRGRIATRGAEQLAEALQQAAAGRSGREALGAVARAYRAYALAHPGVYEAFQRAGAARAQSAERIVGVVLAVLAGYGLQGERAIHATRAVRAALHGFVSLETGGGFAMALSLDESFAELIATLDRGLASGPA